MAIPTNIKVTKTSDGEVVTVKTPPDVFDKMTAEELLELRDRLLGAGDDSAPVRRVVFDLVDE